MRLSCKNSLRLSLIVIFAGVVFIATETYLYNRKNREYITAWQTDLSALQALESLQQLLWRAKKAEGNFLLSRKREYAEQAQSSLTEFQEKLSRWKDDETGNELLNSARQYEQLFATMVSNISRGRLTRGRQIALELSELGEKIQGTIATMSQRRRADLFSQMQASQRLTVKTARTIWVAALLVLIAILFYAIVSARKLARPVRQITDVLQKALDGDLDQRTGLKPRDGMGKIGQSLDKLLFQLKTFDQLKVEKITEEKEKLEAVLNLLSEGVIITDSEGKICLMNNPCLQFFGLSLDGVVEKPVSEIAAMDKRFKDLVTVTLTDRKKITDRKVEISVGMERPAQKTLLVNTALVRRPDGEILYIVVLFRVISKSKKEKMGLKEKIKQALGEKQRE